jgi:hypothetical protein
MQIRPWRLVRPRLAAAAAAAAAATASTATATSTASTAAAAPALKHKSNASANVHRLKNMNSAAASVYVCPRRRPSPADGAAGTAGTAGGRRWEISRAEIYACTLMKFRRIDGSLLFFLFFFSLFFLSFFSCCPFNEYRIVFYACENVIWIAAVSLPSFTERSINEDKKSHYSRVITTWKREFFILSAGLIYSNARQVYT